MYERSSLKHQRAEMVEPAKDSTGLATDQVSVQNQRMKRCSRLLRTSLLVLAFSAAGMANNMVYSTLPDFRVRLQSTMEEISYAFSLGAVGTLTGIPFSIISDKYTEYSDAIIALNMLVAAVVNIIRPCTGSLVVFTLCEFFDEMAWSTLNNVANKVMMSMWKEKGQSPMLAMHLGYPVGAAIGAQIASAFVSRSENYHNTAALGNGSSETTSNLSFTNISTLSNATSEDVISIGKLKIEIAFVICGIYIILLSICLTFLQCFGVKNQRSRRSGKFSWKDIFTPAKWSNNDTKFGIQIFLFFMLFQICFKGGDRGISQYLTTYAVDSDLGFSESEAARLNSIAVLTDALSTFTCAVVIARFLSVKTVFMIQVNGLLLASIGALMFGTKSKIGLYIFACLYQAFKGPTWATNYVWVDHYIILLSTILAFVRVVRNGMDIFMIRLQGYLYTNVSITTIFYTTVGYTGLMCLLVYVIYYVIRGRPFRYVGTKAQGNRSDEKDSDNCT